MQTEEGVSLPPADPNDINILAKAASLTDDQRHTILNRRFIPVSSWKGPLRTIGPKMRRVPALVFDQEHYPTLTYSPQHYTPNHI